ncbi:FtsK/SpoIIIE domain-containing protein [Couchioplanes caeruleus]|uniref:Cell division protein FtsK n=2 Tax=Couchioplanes caeruleus TaxID=56438 RepID=A0A1K0FC44_9ACTN|nr:FtsK/SpoIIIE domain-containing protein [Couchioplanes caeruleus]OJF10401.1 cell division protein FtsK [Couchioplanes caeruleus subsp. caeruleus]ROP29789.1 S-DNA-T family DNA segregation ATPase FtsK/SpoIIIE [Couchioplanes caeruleus]
MSDLTTAPPSIPVGTGLSMFDPLFLGIDEYGHPVYLPLIYRNILIGGEPGAGKSSLLNTIVGHAALCADVDLVLIDGKQVELGLWKDCADVFVGPDLDHAIDTLERLQEVMDNRYAYLLSQRRQKIHQGDDFDPILLAIDELAFFSATVGTKTEQEYFSALNRDIASRGRAVGIIDASATQRPSSDIIPTSLRFLFAWRFAGRCVDESSSDVVLGRGWAARGFSAASIDPDNRGEGLLLAHGGIPARVKGAYMSNDDIIRVADYAAWTRRTRRTTTTTTAAELGAVA